MNNWGIYLTFFFPHERFLIGWEFLEPDDNLDYNSFIISLGFVIIGIDWN
jgi:hypothetical protein